MKLSTCVRNVLGFTFLLTIVIGMSGCLDDPTPTAATSNLTRVPGYGSFSKLRFEEHDYILFDFPGEGGGAICHSESCPCKGSAKVER